MKKPRFTGFFQKVCPDLFSDRGITAMEFPVLENLVELRVGDLPGGDVYIRDLTLYDRRSTD